MHKFFADNVTVLRFSKTPDRGGSLMPPKCQVSIPSKVPVLFGEANSRVGWATVHRFKNVLIANIELSTKMKSSAKAAEMIAELYPCVCGKITAIDREAVTGFDLTAILLSSDGNSDEKIMPLKMNGVLRGSGEVLN